MTDVDEYIAKVPEPGRATLIKTRAIIRAAAPKDAVEKISYGMPSFHHKGGLIWYAAFRGHCSLFPIGPELTARFPEELKTYKNTKATLRFPLDKPLPAALLKKLVKARVAENEAKT